MKYISKMTQTFTEGALLLFLVLTLGQAGHAEVCTVDRLTDAGEGEGPRGDLRYCITSARSGEDTITFEVTGTINLTRALLELTASVTIEGPGAENLTVRRDTGGDYRIFTVGPSTTVVLSGLTTADGQTEQGGGIYVAGGRLTLIASILSNNRAVGRPGGLLEHGGPGLVGALEVQKAYYDKLK